jgi:hypothetical protein
MGIVTPTGLAVARLAFLLVTISHALEPTTTSVAIGLVLCDGSTTWP